MLDLYKRTALRCRQAPAKQFAKTRIKRSTLESERNGAFAANSLGESPHDSSLVGIFWVLFLLYSKPFSLRFVSGVVFLRRPFLLSFYRFVCIGRDIYPKVHGCSPKCFVKYVIFHFLSCMLISYKEKHHIEIMRRLHCGYSKSQIGTLQSHGQRKYLPFPYIKSYKKESEQSWNTTSRCKNFGVISKRLTLFSQNSATLCRFLHKAPRHCYSAFSLYEPWLFTSSLSSVTIL